MPGAPAGEWGRRELQGHRTRVYTVGWNCSGKRLASGSEDQTIRIWSIEPFAVGKGSTEKSDGELRGHGESIINLAWHPKREDQLVSAGDKSVRVWDTRSQKAIATLAQQGTVSVTWSPDGGTIALTNKADSVVLIDTRKYKPYKTCRMSEEVNELMYLPSGKQLLVTTYKGSAEVLNVPSMEQVCTLHGHASTCISCAMAPDQRYIALGGADALVSLWDTESAVCLKTIIGMDMPIRSLSFSADSQLLAYAVQNTNIEIVEVPSGAPVYTIPLADGCDSVAWNPKHPVLAYASDDTRQEGGQVGILALPKGSR